MTTQQSRQILKTYIADKYPSNKTQIVLISGLSGSGKSTVASVLQQEYDFTIVSLADAIKEGVASLTGLTLAEIEQLKNDKTSQVRQALQSIGEVACAKEPFVWCDKATRTIDRKALHSAKHKFVIPDIRKVYERQYFKDNFENVVHIHIERPGLDLSDPKYQHKTEQETTHLQVLSDITIINKYDTLPQFIEAVKIAAKIIFVDYSYLLEEDAK